MRIIKKENLKLFLQKRSLHPKCETRKKLKGVKNRTFCLLSVLSRGGVSRPTTGTKLASRRHRNNPGIIIHLDLYTPSRGTQYTHLDLHTPTLHLAGVHSTHT